MDDKLKPSQEKVIIKNCVESIMEDLDDYYFDELIMKQYKKELFQFFKKISKEYSLFKAGFDFSNKKNIVNDKEKIEKTLELIQDFENLGLSKHYKANAQKMGIMLDKIKKTLEE